jgi:hypothetical protein
MPALVTGRATLIQRISMRLFRRHYSGLLLPAAPAQPTMSWVDGPRTQPRDERGRFLPRAWLADAELFLPADRAWFRHPVSTEDK